MGIRRRSVKTALVIGSAECVHDDRARALALFADAGVTVDEEVFINGIGRDWPGSVDNFATMHVELVEKWMRERKAKGLPTPGQLWCPDGRDVAVKKSSFKYRTVPSWGGSSGLLAVTVALEGLGCDRVVCCGVPLTRTPHFDRKANWQDAKRYHYAWERKLPVIRDKARSMSGWTRGLLGEPTVAWLKGEP